MQVVALAHLQSCNLGNCILLVGVLKGRCEQGIFLHRLGSILGIDAGGAQEQKFLNAMGIGLTNDITLDLHVHHDEIGPVERIGHDAAHEGCCQHYGLGTLLIEKPPDGHLVGQIEFGMGAPDEIRIPPLDQVVPNGRAHKPAMPCHINLTPFV